MTPSDPDILVDRLRSLEDVTVSETITGQKSYDWRRSIVVRYSPSYLGYTSTVIRRTSTSRGKAVRRAYMDFVLGVKRGTIRTSDEIRKTVDSWDKP